MPKRSICHICSVWEGDVDIGSTEWILSCMLAICRLSASGMIENIEVSMDFCAKIIYVKSGFVELCNLRAIME